MKRIAVFLIALLMLCGGMVLAETTIDLSQLTAQELAALIEQAELELSRQEERLIERSLETLKDAYKANYLQRMEQLEERGKLPFEGYLEIVDTRVIYIKDNFKLAEEKMQSTAAKLFQNVHCLVEFSLYSDVGTAPYFPNTGFYTCVIVNKDGSMEATGVSPLYSYVYTRYQFELLAVIESISDRGTEFNNTWYLLK